MPDAIPVTPDNFRRAETDLIFSNFVGDGAFGKFSHNREPTPLDDQKVVRMNRDTLYSAAVFDLEAGPVTIDMPDPGSRFMSLQVWDEDEYCPMVAYGPGARILTREAIGTRYAAVAVRILVDPASPADVGEVQRLQDAIRVEQPGQGRFEPAAWDGASRDQVREALKQLGRTIPDARHMFGARGEVDPVRHLIGVAVGWGGNPEKDAFYVNVTPANNDGKGVWRLHVPADVPVEGFWSVTVYDRDGYFQPNPQNAYSVNNVTAAKNPDGSVDVQFGGCGGNAVNCLPITPGWNITVRLYRPQPEILDGSWTFPEPQLVQ